MVNTATVSGDAVYVTAYDQSAYNPGCTPAATCAASTAHSGWVFGYAVGSGGALTAATSSPYEAGVKPSAIVAEPTNRFLYVTDYASNDLIGYGIASGNKLNFLINGPYKTANEPSAIAIDPRGNFIYVTQLPRFDGQRLRNYLGPLVLRRFRTSRQPATPRTLNQSPSPWTRRWAGLSIRPTIWATPSPASG